MHTNLTYLLLLCFCEYINLDVLVGSPSVHENVSTLWICMYTRPIKIYKTPSAAC